MQISNELCDKIELYQYEVNCRKDLIAYILSNNLNIDSEQFKKYQEEYKEFYIKYEKAKTEMKNEYLGETFKGEWSLDFASRELTVK